MTDFYFATGGTLPQDAPSYIPRQADADLYQTLKQGEYCYVLTSRQMGKSSLMVRVANRLREDGLAVVVFELTAIGINVTVEQWYEGLMLKIGEQLDLADELDDFWYDNEQLGPLQRLMQALRQIVLPQIQQPMVICFDEIDVVRSLPFSTDEFFAAIRECYNARTQEPNLQRLTFCLIGVATPSDLIAEPRITPFNIGKRIDLADFSEIEAAKFGQGLRDDKLLKRILYWTNGHPYLTQKLCQLMVDDEMVVDKLCEEVFFSSRSRDAENNLQHVRTQVLDKDKDTAALLDLYRQVRSRKKIRDDDTNSLINTLRLSGLVRIWENYLEVRNRIYFRVFDKAWINGNMPNAEKRRQKAALRRGVMYAGLVGWVIIILIGYLAFLAMQAEEKAREVAIVAQEAEKTAKEALKMAEDQKEVAQFAKQQEYRASYAETKAKEALKDAKTKAKEVLKRIEALKDAETKAKEALKKAEEWKNKALLGESLFLAEMAKQQIKQGNTIYSIILALAALPESIENPERPFVAKAEIQLYKAVSELDKSVAKLKGQALINQAFQIVADKELFLEQKKKLLSLLGLVKQIDPKFAKTLTPKLRQKLEEVVFFYSESERDLRLEEDEEALLNEWVKQLTPEQRWKLDIYVRIHERLGYKKGFGEIEINIQLTELEALNELYDCMEKEHEAWLKEYKAWLKEPYEINRRIW